MRVQLAVGALCALASASILGTARAAVTPVIGQSGHNCGVQRCGDYISADVNLGGYVAPFTVRPENQGPFDFKPNAFYFEVPEDKAVRGRPVPFVLSWYDLGIGGAYDVCYDSGGNLKFDEDTGAATACDTATVVRIYPPAYAFNIAACTDGNGSDGAPIAQFEVEATPSENPRFQDYFNCGFLARNAGSECKSDQPNCCQFLDDDFLNIDFSALFLDPDDSGPLSPALDIDCAVPGTWKVEVDTSEASSFSSAYTNPGRTQRTGEPMARNDIDVYRFGVYQDRRSFFLKEDPLKPDEPPPPNPLCSSQQFIRMWSPAVNLTNVERAGAGQKRSEETLVVPINAVLFPNVSGGWLTSFDVGFWTADLGQSGDRIPIAGFQAPGMVAPLDLTSEPNIYRPEVGIDFLSFDTIQPRTDVQEQGFIIRQTVPFTFLALAPLPKDSLIYPRDGGIQGYPYPAFEIGSQGLWAVNYRYRTLNAVFDGDGNPTGEVTGKIVTVSTVLQDNPLPLGTPVLPDVSTNAKIYFPFDDRAAGPCDEVTASIPAGNQTGQGLQTQLEGAQKPALAQVVRSVGRDPTEPGRRCYELQVSLTNPVFNQGPIRTPIDDGYGILLNIVNSEQPGLGRVRFVGVSEYNELKCKSFTDGRNTTCPSEDRNFTCNQETFTTAPSAVRIEFQLNQTPSGGGRALPILDPGDTAFARVILIAELDPTTPTFLTGRGEFGTSGRWQDETTPLNVDPVKDGNPDPFLILAREEQDLQGLLPRFGVPSGGSGDEDGEGGTSPSTGGANDPDPTLATLRDVRVFVDRDGNAQVELESDVEVASAGFEVLARIDGEWQPAAPFLRAVPNRPAAIYRAELWTPDATELRVVEHELAHRTRLLGTWKVEPEVSDALPLLGPEGTLSYARPDVRFTFPTPLQNRQTATESDRARVVVPSGGVFRVPYAAIADSTTRSRAEVASAAASGSLRLTRDSRTVAYEAQSDHLLFWAKAPEGEESDTASYELAFAQGLTIGHLAAPPLAMTPPESYEERLVFEQDLEPAPATQSDFSNEDFWMWRFLLAGSASDGVTAFTFDAPDRSGDTAQLRVAIRGGSETGSFPDHEVVFRLNGEEVHRSTFYGFDVREERIVVPTGLLQEHGNTLEIEAVKRPNALYSVVWVDRFELRYPRRFEATNDVALLHTDGAGAIEVRGFSGGDVRVWEVSDGAVIALDDTEMSGDAVRFGWPASHGEFVAFAPDALPTAGLYPLAGDAVRTIADGAEYLVVAHEGLLDSAQALADYRADQGLSTLVLSAREVYDAYTSGERSARAMEELLYDAYDRWTVPPRYLVIVGDGTIDPRDRMGFGDNLVTPPILASAEGKFASDTALGRIQTAGAGYSVAVGRIPGHSNEEVTAYLEKVRAFEALTRSIAEETAFVLADNPDDGGNFEASFERALASFGQSFLTDGMVLDPEALDVARDRVLQAIDEGTRYLHFIGHGGLDSLTGEGVLTRADVASLSNQGSPFVLLAAACLLGRFDLPGIRGLTEELLLNSAGTAAVFASAGLESNEESTALARLVAEILASGTHARLGAVVAEASTIAPGLGISPQSVQLHTLLGDPALRVSATGNEWAPLERAQRAAPEVPTVSGTEAPRDSEAPVEAAPQLSPDAPQSSGCAATGSGWWVLLGALALLRRRRR